MKNSINSHFAIAILSLVAACVFCALVADYYLYEISGITKKQHSGISHKKSEIKSLNAAQILNVDDWTVYENPIIGIRFQYPEALGIVSEARYTCDDGTTSTCPLHMALSFGEGDLFMGTQNKAMTDDQPGRGGYFGDRSGDIINEQYISSFCEQEKGALIDSCETYQTGSGILVAEIAGPQPFTSGEIRMLTFPAHSPSSDFYGLAFSNRGLRDLPGLSVVESEEVMRGIVKSLEFISMNDSL